VAYCSQYIRIIDDAVGCEKTKRLHPNYDGNTKFAMLFAEDKITFNILQRMGQGYNYCRQQTTFSCSTVAVSY